jgi:hypothetical protein
MAKSFHLRFLENEDEAQHTGYEFEPRDGNVFVARTYHHPEYSEHDPGNVMPVDFARLLWKKLVDSGRYIPVA